VDAIRESLSRFLEISGDRIGIKAKTPEGMGTENAAIAHAVVLLQPSSSQRVSGTGRKRST
jgi:2C-methyl-D-erythritol 2,4-cyclodiphosphate synthase